MKRMSSIIVGSLVAVLIVGGTFAAELHAQSGPGVVFSVPFAFTVDGHNVAAGNYELNLVSSEFLMSIRDRKTGKLQVFDVHPDQERSIEERGRLIFESCGDHRYLTEFHIPGTNVYSTAMSPRRLKDTEAKACPATDFVTVAAR